MKVLAINGSARRKGNTHIALETALKEIKKAGIETEIVSLAEKKIHGCRACYKCFEKKNKRCVFVDDDVNGIIEKMLDADGIIIGSPVYFSTMTSETKALIDRAGIVAKCNDDMFARKVGASIAIARRAGACATFQDINQFFFISGMIVPGSTYWNIGFGREIGEVRNDKEGMTTFKNLGRNIAWVLKKLNA